MRLCFSVTSQHSGGRISHLTLTHIAAFCFYRSRSVAAGLIADSAAYSTPSKGAELQWWVKNHQGDFHRAAWHSWTLDTLLLAFASQRKPIKRSFSDVAD